MSQQTYVTISVRKRVYVLHAPYSVVFSDVVRAHHVTKHNTPIHNILSTTPQLSISQKALGTLPKMAM
jgi:hypothetical protein